MVLRTTLLLLEPQMSTPWYWDAIVLSAMRFEPASMTSTPFELESGNDVLWSALRPITLFWTVLPLPDDARLKLPRKTSLKLFATTLPSLGVGPPIVVEDASTTWIPMS